MGVLRLITWIVLLTLFWSGLQSHAATTDTGDPVYYSGPNTIDAANLTVSGVPVSLAGASGSEYAAARLATTGTITLSGEQTIDGVLTAGSAVVVWLQTNATQNGIYVSGTGGWVRRNDLDISAEFAGNKSVFVQAGTRYAGTVFRVANTGTVTLGSTAISLIPESAQWHVSPLQTLASGGTISCASPAGQYVGVSTTVVSVGGLMSLGVPQIVAGTRTNQLCRIKGTSDLNAVQLNDANGVLLAQATDPVLLDARSTITLEWSGALWRQIDQLGVGGGGGGGTSSATLQSACDAGATCGWTNLTQTRPLRFRGTPTGPYEDLYELGGNFVRERKNADGSPAAPEVIRLRADHVLSVHALMGTPTASWQDVATIENVGGVSIATTGVFALAKEHIGELTGAHPAMAISFVPTSDIPATNVQQAIEQVRSAIGGAGAPTGLLNVQRTSPAVNAGLCVATVTVDIDGVIRPQQALCDMGAYEASAVQLGPSQAVSMDTVSPNNAFTTYVGVTGSGASTTTATQASTWPISGIITGLICQVNTPPGAGNAWTVRLRVNAVDAAVTCTITDPAVECEDLANALTVARGVRVGYALIPTSAPVSPTSLSCGLTFTAS